jgi:molecular chaperone HscB
MQDAFDVLGLEAKFDLARSQIERAYFARSARLHPDIAAGREDAAREMAELNRAKATLEHPERRADALLKRLGGPSREEHRNLPEGFLMEIMEVREEIEAAAASPDPEEKERARSQWEAWAERQRGRAMEEVRGMFAAAGASGSKETLASIRTRLNAWRYIERLIEQLDPDYDPARADFEDR